MHALSFSVDGVIAFIKNPKVSEAAGVVWEAGGTGQGILGWNTYM
jgi:hypothetical protein